MSIKKKYQAFLKLFDVDSLVLIAQINPMMITNLEKDELFVTTLRTLFCIDYVLIVLYNWLNFNQ